MAGLRRSPRPLLQKGRAGADWQARLRNEGESRGEKAEDAEVKHIAPAIHLSQKAPLGNHHTVLGYSHHFSHHHCILCFLQCFYARFVYKHVLESCIYKEVRE